MYPISKEQNQILEEFDVNYRCVVRDGKVYAEIIDNATKQVYIDAPGDDPFTAVSAAIEKIPTTPKPRTEAQIKADVNSQALTDKDAEIAALKAQLAAATAQASTPTPSPAVLSAAPARRSRSAETSPASASAS